MRMSHEDKIKWAMDHFPKIAQGYYEKYDDEDEKERIAALLVNHLELFSKAAGVGRCPPGEIQCPNGTCIEPGQSC